MIDTHPTQYMKDPHVLTSTRIHNYPSCSSYTRRSHTSVRTAQSHKIFQRTHLCYKHSAIPHLLRSFCSHHSGNHVQDTNRSCADCTCSLWSRRHICTRMLKYAVLDTRHRSGNLWTDKDWRWVHNSDQASSLDSCTCSLSNKVQKTLKPVIRPVLGSFLPASSAVEIQMLSLLQGVVIVLQAPTKLCLQLIPPKEPLHMQRYAKSPIFSQ